MRKRIIIDFGLFITGGIVFWIILSIWNYYNEISLVEKISNEMMGNEAIYFQTTSETLDFHEIYTYLPEDGILYNNLSWDKNYKSIIFKENIPTIPILEGRFFEQTDREKKVAVVGKNIAENLQKSDPIIDINGIEYEVIGIIGVEYTTKLDNTVWVIMNNENINCSSTFTLDGLDKDRVFSYLGQAKIWSDILILDRENLSILEVIDRKKDYWVFPSMVILVGLGYSLILLKRWLEIHRNEIRVRKELGYPSLTIIRILLIQSMIPYGTGVLITFTILVMIRIVNIQRILLPLIISLLLFLLLWILIGLTFATKRRRIDKKRI